jgi:hypothetical protein
VPTIKTQLFDGILKVLTKTTDGQVAVSCSCCCFCSDYDLDDLLYDRFYRDALGEFGFPILAEECGDFSAFEAIKPDGTGVDMKEACLRWLCRQTILTESGPETLSTPIGGPTTNDRDLNDIILECLGEREGEEFAGLANGANGVPPEEYSVCYLYAFEFFGWQKRGRTVPPVQDPIWVSSDIIVSIYRRDDPL